MFATLLSRTKGCLPWRPIGSRGAISSRRWGSRPVRRRCSVHRRSPRAAPANEKIRLILIGAGSRGNQLLDSFLPRPDVEIVAVADVDDHHAGETAERIKKAKKNTPDTARDYRAMLDRKDVDARDHRHARPLARPARDPGRAGRQGRLRREAGRPQRRRGPGDAPRRPQDQQDHGRRHPAAVLVAFPEGRRDRPLGQARQGLLGPDLELREHQPRRHWASIPTARRHPTSTTSAGSAPRRCGRSTPIDSTSCSAGSSTTPAA